MYFSRHGDLSAHAFLIHYWSCMLDLEDTVSEVLNRTDMLD